MEIVSVVLLILVIILAAHVVILGKERRRLQVERDGVQGRLDELTSISNDLFNSHARLEAQVLLNADRVEALERCRGDLMQAEAEIDLERGQRQRAELDLADCQHHKKHLAVQNGLLYGEVEDLREETQRLLTHVARLMDKK